MEKRQSGFYWVKVAGRPPEWWVGEYSDTTGAVNYKQNLIRRTKQKI